MDFFIGFIGFGSIRALYGAEIKMFHNKSQLISVNRYRFDYSITQAGTRRILMLMQLHYLNGINGTYMCTSVYILIENNNLFLTSTYVRTYIHVLYHAKID